MLYSMPLTGSTPEDEIQEILEHILPPEDLNRYGFSFVVPKTPDSFESLESLLVKHKIHEPLLGHSTNLKYVKLELAIPGVSSNEIVIKLLFNGLYTNMIVYAYRPVPRQETGREYLSQEIEYGGFCQIINLDLLIPKPEHTFASSADGIHTILIVRNELMLKLVHVLVGYPFSSSGKAISTCLKYRDILQEVVQDEEKLDLCWPLPFDEKESKYNIKRFPKILKKMDKDSYWNVRCPPMDLDENPLFLFVRIEIPGVPLDEIKIKCINDTVFERSTLVVYGRRPAPPGLDIFESQDIRYGGFCRVLPLGKLQISEERQILRFMVDGVLTILVIKDEQMSGLLVPLLPLTKLTLIHKSPEDNIEYKAEPAKASQKLSQK